MMAYHAKGTCADTLALRKVSFACNVRGISYTHHSQVLLPACYAGDELIPHVLAPSPLPLPPCPPLRGGGGEGVCLCHANQGAAGL